MTKKVKITKIKLSLLLSSRLTSKQADPNSKRTTTNRAFLTLNLNKNKVVTTIARSMTYRLPLGPQPNILKTILYTL